MSFHGEITKAIRKMDGIGLESGKPDPLSRSPLSQEQSSRWRSGIWSSRRPKEWKRENDKINRILSGNAMRACAQLLDAVRVEFLDALCVEILSS